MDITPNVGRLKQKKSVEIAMRSLRSTSVVAVL